MQRRFSNLVRCGGFVLSLALLGSAQAATSREELFAALQNMPHPASAAEFQAARTLPCMNQGKTSICWSFATSSFVEAEMARLNLEPVRLSVMYPVYCACVAKARRFVQTQGASRFSPGDLFVGVPDDWLEQGALPAAAYDPAPGEKPLDHGRLYAELNGLKRRLKRQHTWDESAAVAQASEILNRHLGTPPEVVSWHGHTCTPREFLAEAVRLPWTNYVMLTSFESAPVNTFTDLKVPDNWRHNSNFFNVALPLFYESFKNAVRDGFSVAVSMDVTEPSYKYATPYCFIPAAELPPEKITQRAREIRFQNGETTDDHAVHIIGYRNIGGEDWFLAKDSWKSAWREGNTGALFIHSSYVKLKILAFIVHRDGVPEAAALMRRGG